MNREKYRFDKKLQVIFGNQRKSLAWDKENGYAYPKYPDECVLCLQCEMDCLNGAIDIYPIATLQVDPLEYSAKKAKECNRKGDKYDV